MNFMKDKKIRKASFLILISFVASLLFLDHNASQTAWSVLPPAIAIFLAFVSGRLSVSLGAAVFLGSFISIYGASQNVVGGVTGGTVKMLGFFWSAASDPANLQILGFVFFILSMVHVMTISGGLHALVNGLKIFVVGPRSAQVVTALMGCLIFIDDYANTMIVGTTMKSVTDRFGISRQKLAFLVDATSAPIAGVALVSTWIGFEVGLFKDVSEKFNLGMDGYAIFLDAIPFRFYCFFMLIFVFVNAAFGIDFGPMKRARSENINTELEENPKGHISCALVPLGVLLTLVFSLLWYDGGGFSPDKSILSLTSWRAVLTKSENGILILLISSMISYATSLFFAIAISRVAFKKLWESFVGGVKSSMLPIMILVLAWSLKAVCDDLNTGEFIVSVLGDRVNPFWMPMAIFIVSAVTAFSTGTSWGTMAILIPTVAPLALALSPDQQYSGFVALCLASILDGAIMGDHCSPVSDTTIMSSISTDCDLLEHVKTQLPYTLFVGSVALLFGYLPMSLGWSYGLFFFLAATVIIGLYVALKFWPQSRRAL